MKVWVLAVVLILAPLVVGQWIQVSNSPGVSLWSSGSNCDAMVCAVNSSANVVWGIDKTPLGFTTPTTLNSCNSSCYVNSNNYTYLNFSNDLEALYVANVPIPSPSIQSGSVLCPSCKAFAINGLASMRLDRNIFNPDAGTLTTGLIYTSTDNLSFSLNRWENRAKPPGVDIHITNIDNVSYTNLTRQVNSTTNETYGYKLGGYDPGCAGDCQYYYTLASNSPLYQEGNRIYTQHLAYSLPLAFTTLTTYSRTYVNFGDIGRVCNSSETIDDGCLTISIDNTTASVNFRSNGTIDPNLTQSYVSTFSGWPWLNRTMVSNLGVGLDAPILYMNFNHAPETFENITITNPTGTVTGTFNYDIGYDYTDSSYTHDVRVYAYKNTYHGRVYSSNYISNGGITDAGTGLQSYYIHWNWSAVTGATGYRVLKQDDYNPYSWDAYFDTTDTFIDDGIPA